MSDYELYTTDSSFIFLVNNLVRLFLDLFWDMNVEQLVDAILYSV